MLALHKAKRVGKKKVLFIATPVGNRYGALIPKIDMYFRLLMSKMVSGKISASVYKEGKEKFFTYYDLLSQWLDSSVKKVAEDTKKSLRKRDIQFFLKNLDVKKVNLYLNTNMGEDFFNLAVQSDKFFKILLIGHRYNLVSIKYVEDVSIEFTSIMNVFQQELIKIGASLWD